MLFLSWLSPLKRARRAARAAQWAAAVAAYRAHLARRPTDGAAWVQLSHSLKETGALEEAAAAYRTAAAHLSEQAEVWIHLAYLERRLGRREAAIAALQEALAMADGGSAAQALIEMGARERLPSAAQQSIEAQSGDYALSRYPAWTRAGRRPSLPLPTGAQVLALIDARGADPAHVAITRETLGDIPCRVMTEGTALVTAAGADWLLLMEAGTRLAPDAAGQLHAAATGTGAGAAYADHDHWTAEADGIAHHDPCFQPMADPVWFARAAVRPPVLLLRAEAAAAADDWEALVAGRMELPLRYAHVPLVLASRAEPALVDLSAPATPAAAADPAPIQIIIQTRDAPALLTACINSLRRTAAHPNTLDIVIMDNRSVLPETAALLAGWQAEGIARPIAHDEPFNWARANNLAAARGNAPLLLFLNNDVEMETPGWDVALRDGLARPRTGAMGALLLYPDRLIQHAGVIFGMGREGGAVHEGVLHPTEPGGPAARWRHPRCASAVTGAWLAVSRTLFDAVGGFEERLPIAYNDVDFCLRIRAAGVHVVQASNIVAVHRESATRGSVMSTAEHARDRADWAWIRERWGAALDLDPAFNPNWARSGQPFDGLRRPPAEVVAQWIEASVRPDPWAVVPTAEG
ncbi:GT2 family glycosyltransferase [Sphingomonas sp. PvP055]|uniref:glycosyltransferase family 2 protein n=1 Tax=Sphingomonas sp. PvP055 TaxID=3156391 RepID=UPI0033936424